MSSMEMSAYLTMTAPGWNLLSLLQVELERL